MRPRHVAQALRRMGPYLWSHHPHCAPFAADVVRVGSRRVCIACFVGYPAIAASWLAAALAAPPEVPAWVWLLAGALLIVPQGLSFAGRVPGAPVQVAVKLALGAGIGLVGHGITALPLPLAARAVLLVAALAAVQSLWVLRLHRLDRTCRACPQLALRPRCEGLQELDDRVGALLRQAPAGPGQR